MGVLAQMPCTIRRLKVPRTSAGFLDFDEYEKLLDATGHEPVEALLVTLLGGDAGLRCGEMMALR